MVAPTSGFPVASVATAASPPMISAVDGTPPLAMVLASVIAGAAVAASVCALLIVAWTLGGSALNAALCACVRFVGRPVAALIACTPPVLVVGKPFAARTS